jgi:hypothetical protein
MQKQNSFTIMMMILKANVTGCKNLRRWLHVYDDIHCIPHIFSYICSVDRTSPFSEAKHSWGSQADHSP